MIVLLVNDHLLKQAWPGFVTGKLSDVAGLLVAPPLLALLLRRRADAAAVLLTGALFAAVKTTETGAEAASQAWTLVAGHSRVLADPTDLLALPALALAWWVRRHATAVPPRTRILLATPLAVLAVTATSIAPLSDAEEVWVEGAAIVATVRRGEIEVSSLDGGNTWSSGPARPGSEGRGQSAACVPRQGQRCYRIVQGLMRVEESDDGGSTWRLSWEVSPTRVRLLKRALEPYTGYYDRKPLASFTLAVQQRPGGQHVVVVANGLDGVAVRDTAGTWRRLGFGKSGGLSEADATPVNRFGAYVWTETTVALLAGLGVFALALGLSRPRRRVTIVVIVNLVGCLCAALLPIAPDVSPTARLAGPLGLLAVVVTVITLLVMTGMAGLMARELTAAFGAGVFTALAVALPFHGWSAGWPEDHGTALGLSVVLGLATAATGLVAARRTAT
ncbi:hypothetical protein [Nonomuraea dietziae]|uniref:Uncharacterized protein n=1 Tax=Nonomuraea dietziae TaxID=65515 RepID=A0A7W5V7J9_9ACTN|nr:hypothetical protein [Nonomuraea dietziae]MBB3729491.1 hypothetical protein [Nonomuraea dietziae]